MIKYFLIPAVFFGILINQVACWEPFCLENCDKDYTVITDVSTFANGYLTKLCLKITPKVPLHMEWDDATFKSHYGQFDPVVKFGDHTFKDVEEVWIGYHTNSTDIGTFPYYQWGSISNSKELKDVEAMYFCMVFDQVDNPTSSKEGAKTVYFYHTKQTKDRKFFANTFYFDITQNPPKQVGTAAYHNLPWVKALVALGK